MFRLFCSQASTVAIVTGSVGLVTVPELYRRRPLAEVGVCVLPNTRPASLPKGELTVSDLLSDSEVASSRKRLSICVVLLLLLC